MSRSLVPFAVVVSSLIPAAAWADAPPATQPASQPASRPASTPSTPARQDRPPSTRRFHPGFGLESTISSCQPSGISIVLLGGENYYTQLLAERHYLMCIQAGQLGIGLSTLKWLAELHGHQPAPLIRNTVKAQATAGGGLQRHMESMSDQELERRLDELRAMQG